MLHTSLYQILSAFVQLARAKDRLQQGQECALLLDVEVYSSAQVLLQKYPNNMC